MYICYGIMLRQIFFIAKFSANLPHIFRMLQWVFMQHICFSTLLNIGYKSSLSVQQAIDSFYIDFSNMQQCAASAAAIFFPFQVMLLCKVLCNSVVKIKIRTVCCNQKTMLHTYCKMETTSNTSSITKSMPKKSIIYHFPDLLHFYWTCC